MPDLIDESQLLEAFRRLATELEFVEEYRWGTGTGALDRADLIDRSGSHSPIPRSGPSRSLPRSMVGYISSSMNRVRGGMIRDG